MQGALAMNYRRFGQTGWKVSEIGYGMWGLAGWTGSDDAESMAALERSVELGCNFFDTAWAYGSGKSERMLGALLRQQPTRHLYVATKIPPRNLRWTGLANIPLDDVFPPQHIHEYTHRS